MSLPRWFAHSLWQPDGADRYHHQCRSCNAVLKQAKREGLREVGLVVFGLVGAISMFFHMYPLLPEHHYGWVITEFVGWIMMGGAVTTLLHYPIAKYVPAAPETHGYVPVSKVV